MAERRHDAVNKAERALHDQQNLLPRSQLIGTIAIMGVTMFISFIDQNGISTTLPIIAADLNAEDTISWAGTASLIANTTFQMLYGRLSDIFGRKTVYLAAVASLSIADLLCGLSKNAAMFYVFRGLAGIGGGGITNLAMIIISDIVTLEKRGKYQGIYGSMIGLGNVCGPFLAAVLAAKATWRAFFWMLSPAVALTGVLSWWLLPGKPPTDGFKESVKKVDWWGSFWSSVAVIFILIPVSGGGAYFAWDSALVISMLTIGMLSLVIFILVEWKVAKLPMMPVDIYMNHIVVVIMTQSFLFGLVSQALYYYVPIYLQNAHQYSAIVSASIFVTLTGTQSVCSTLAGLYISTFKRYGEVIWFGFGIWTLGAGLTITYTRHTSPGLIIVPLLLIGLGVGCVFQPTLIAVQAHSPQRRRAVIISNRNFFRCAGGACGLAVSAALLQARLRSALPPEWKHLAHSTYSVPKGPLPADVLDAYMEASRAVFILLVPLIGICFLGCIFVKDRGLQPKEDEIADEMAMEENGRTDDTQRPDGLMDLEEGNAEDGLVRTESSLSRIRNNHRSASANDKGAEIEEVPPSVRGS